MLVRAVWIWLGSTHSLSYQGHLLSTATTGIHSKNLPASFSKRIQDVLSSMLQ